jgi:hypothetical protein
MATENQYTIHWMIPVITQLWMNLTELVYGFTLLPNYVRNRSSFIAR